jgi:hypothetical protein
MNGLPMTGESYIGATRPVAAPPSRETAPASPAPSHAEAGPKPAAPVVQPAATAAPLPPSFPISLRFDPETQRLIIEAKDSSGLIVFQLPFKSASPPQTRGQRLNSKA